MLYMNLTNNLTKKSEDNNKIFNKSRRKKKNSLILPSHSTNYLLINRPNTAKFIYDKKSIIKPRVNSAFNSISITKKPTTPTTVGSVLSPAQSQIYKKLDINDKIEKIIKEESKKIYFKQRITYGYHLSVEELRSRFMNPIPQNAYKRQLKRRIKEKLKLKAKNFFERTKKEKSDDKLFYHKIPNQFNNLIKNQKLIRNFTPFSKGKEINYKNLVNDYLEKVAKINRKRSSILREPIREYKEKMGLDLDNIIQKTNSSKMTNKRFKSEKKHIRIRNINKLKEKARVFDNIIIDELNSNLEKIKTVENDTVSRNKINYVALTNKIFLTNLIKQMKIIYIKDPPMNVLRGNTSKKIMDLKKEVSLYDEFEALYNKYNDDITFSRYNKIKLTLPKFIKTKFKNNLKFDSYFGIPV